MTRANRWLLPDGIEELLPPKAEAAEQMRRQLLDLFRSWGYELVLPPLIEYTDSLLVGLGSDVDLLTFKSVDQLTGRLLGVRADITPQVARIDAHSLAREQATRLCYAGSVLHTKPTSLTASRAPIQIGAELYGDSGVASDIEIVSLMLETLTVAGAKNITLDLGHVGIYRDIIANAGLTADQEQALFDALQRKAATEIDQILSNSDVADQSSVAIKALLGLHGDRSVIAQARQVFSSPAILAALEQLEKTAEVIAQRMPGVNVYFDLCELRGYHYHTGLVFAAYVPGNGQALANGGRYDHIGEVFGRARPATGFNVDLKMLIDLAENNSVSQAAIYVPNDTDPQLWIVVQQLRAQGECIISGLTDTQIDSRCDRQLKKVAGQWQVEAL